MAGDPRSGLDVRYHVAMATVLLFHHAQGQTTGFLAFADELRNAGYEVHAPNLYDGHTFGDLDYAGFSLGALPAQSLAQTRPGARGAILFLGCVPTSEFGSSWPEGVPLQIHTMDADPWTELDVAEALIQEAGDAELFLYPGPGHLFADSSLDDHDEQAARLLKERTLALLRRVG
jgi:dienelactone hydrolase